jgi:hypothetical protein
MYEYGGVSERGGESGRSGSFAGLDVSIFAGRCCRRRRRW